MIKDLKGKSKREIKEDPFAELDQKDPETPKSHL